MKNPTPTSTDLIGKPPRDWFCRRNVWTFSALGIGLPVCWMLWGIFGWLPPIRISPETTWLTEPLQADGYIDYLNHLQNDYLAQGGTAPSEDRWYRILEDELETARSGRASTKAVAYINPTTALQNSFSDDLSIFERQQQITEFEDDVLVKLSLEPWKSDDHPIVAETVVANAPWYSEIENTYSPISAVDFPLPSQDSLAGYIGLVCTSSTQRIVERFLMRAGYHFGKGEPRPALDDIAFAYNAAGRERLCMIQLLVRRSLETKITSMAVMGLLSSAEFNPEVIQRIEALPINSMLDEFTEMIQVERIIVLDYLAYLHRKRFVVSVTIDTQPPPSLITWLAARQRAGSLDWNELLRHENKLVDEIITTLRNNEWQDAHRRLNELCHPDGADGASKRISDGLPWLSRPGTNDYRLSLAKEHQLILQGHKAVASMLLSRRVVKIAARLSVWKQKHGQFPPDLESLKSLTEFPDTPDELFTDPFTSDLLSYKLTDSGFEIRSPGSNGKPDSSEWQQLSNESPAPKIEVDLVWRWPVSAE